MKCYYCENEINYLAFKGYRTIDVCSACGYMLSQDGYTVTNYLGQVIYS